MGGRVEGEFSIKSSFIINGKEVLMIPYVLLGMSRDRAVVFTEINYENPFTNDAAADDVATTATAGI